MLGIKKKFSDQEFIDGILSDDSRLLYELYYQNLPAIKKSILNNGGNIQDVKDVYQVTILSFIEQIKKNKFNHDCSLDTYIFSIAKKLWLKELRRRRKSIFIESDVDLQADLEDFSDFDFEYASVMQKSIFMKHFALLNEDCKKILDMFFKKISDEEVANKLNVSNKHAVVQRRARCKLYLIESVRQDPMYKEVFDYE
ncbi:MAG: sigma-70 family RNA polymerase sigma factor [Bacteroidetes bacterium]|nr:sigma-70 family RNA polymerase sigma factor [Bacteroidota bacterium]